MPRSSARQLDEERRQGAIPRCTRRRRPAGYFGMKMHIGVDSRGAGARRCSPRPTCDKHPRPSCCTADQPHYGDNAYASQKELISQGAAGAGLRTKRVRRGGELDEARRAKNRNKSGCAPVWSVFAVVSGCGVSAGALSWTAKNAAFARGAGSVPSVPGSPWHASAAGARTLSRSRRAPGRVSMNSYPSFHPHLEPHLAIPTAVPALP